MFVVRTVVHVIALAKCVMGAMHVKERFFMHRKEKLVPFMIVLKIVNVSGIAGTEAKKEKCVSIIDFRYPTKVGCIHIIECSK